jgi:cytoskeletal protein CcmA (bactofilin family)
MREVHDKLEGVQSINDELRLFGMIAGDAAVEPGGVLHLHGMIVGDLLIRDGGEAEVHGMVVGSVHNDGVAVVDGTVTGRVSGSGHTTIAPNAVVRNES